MNDLAAYFAGIITGVIANRVTAMAARLRAYKSAERLVGKWDMYTREGRSAEVPVYGALTEVVGKPFWFSRFSDYSHIRRIEAIDPSGREHNGYIVIDPTCPWRATRTILYLSSDEIAEQRIEIGPSGRVMYVFPVSREDGYGQHVLRKCD